MTVCSVSLGKYGEWTSYSWGNRQLSLRNRSKTISETKMVSSFSIPQLPPCSKGISYHSVSDSSHQDPSLPFILVRHQFLLALYFPLTLPFGQGCYSPKPISLFSLYILFIDLVLYSPFTFLIPVTYALVTKWFLAGYLYWIFHYFYCPHTKFNSSSIKAR